MGPVGVMDPLMPEKHYGRPDDLKCYLAILSFIGILIPGTAPGSLSSRVGGRGG